MHIQEVRIQNFRVFEDEGISFTFNASTCGNNCAKYILEIA